jgi:hypothetical protein
VRCLTNAHHGPAEIRSGLVITKPGMQNTHGPTVNRRQGIAL